MLPLEDIATFESFDDVLRSHQWIDGEMSRPTAAEHIRLSQDNDNLAKGQDNRSNQGNNTRNPHFRGRSCKTIRAPLAPHRSSQLKHHAASLD